MVLIIHGFPNEISALRFEWAWQNPEKSLRLKHLVPKTKQYNFIFKFNVVCEMLRIGPWCRLPLNVRWLKQEYEKEFNINKLPPSHMPIVYGPVTIIDSSKNSKKVVEKQDSTSSNKSSDVAVSKNCFICKLQCDSKILDTLKCIKCHVNNHQICLAKHFVSLEPSFLLPLEGNCPKCKQTLLWGDLVRYRSGCYRDLNNTLIDDLEDDCEVIDTDSD
jgi:structure-specific endonuclease subunit SLX1